MGIFKDIFLKPNPNTKMKFATLAIFLGVISAEQFDEELINELKIEISKAGQRAIEKEARDVGMTLKKIENSKPVRNLEASFKKSKWSKMYEGALQRAFTNKEAKSVERRLKAFKVSSEGKRLEKEMRDLDASLKKNVKITD